MSSTSQRKRDPRRSAAAGSHGIMLSCNQINDTTTTVAVGDLDFELQLRELHDDAVAAIKAGALEQAMALCRKTLEICPQEHRFRLVANNNLGSYYYHQKQYEKAQPYLLATLEIAPTYTFSLAILAKIYLATGNSELADMMFKRAIASCVPDNKYWAGSKEAFSVMFSTYEAFGDYQGLVQLALKHEEQLTAEMMYKSGIEAFNLERYHLTAKWMEHLAAQEDRKSILNLLCSVARVMDAHDLPPFQLQYNVGSPDLPHPNMPDVLTDGMKCAIIDVLWHRELVIQVRTLQKLTKSADPWIEPFLRAVMLQQNLGEKIKHTAGSVLCERGAVKPGEAVMMHVDGKIKSVVMELPVVTAQMRADAEKAFHRGNSHLSKQRWTTAETEYRRALSLNPDLHEASLNLAHALRSMQPVQPKRLAEARRLLESSVKHLPHIAIAWYSLIMVLAAQDDYEAVERVINKVKLADLPTPLAMDVYRVKGNMALFAGRCDAAEQAYRAGMALAADPVHKQVMQESLNLVAEVRARCYPPAAQKVRTRDKRRSKSK